MFSASKRGVFVADGSENTIAHLTAEKLRRHRFAFPLKNEQKVIASHLDVTLADFDRTIDRAQREIDLLREYRTRLIADVVTGKLDVREVVEAGNDLRPYPGLPEEAAELDDLDPGEDTEVEEIVDTVEEA